MGKSKSSKRFGARRVTPTGTVIEKEIDFVGDADSGIIPAVVTNIIEQLQSPAKEERACGCQHLSRIVSHPRAIGILLEQEIIKIVAPLFLDSSPDVQKSALGAMRNMSLFGEEAACNAMVKNDVITPLSVVVKKFGGNFDADLKRDTPATLLEAVELLSNLCENSSRALQMFNKEGIVSILLPLLNAEKCGYPLSNAVAHCLHVVSENNLEVSKVCREPEVLSQLMSFVSTSPSTIDAVLFRTRIIGTLLNLSEVDLSPYYDHFIGVLGEVLDMDSLPLVSLTIEGGAVSSQGDETTDHDDISQQDVDKLIAAQRDSLEMVANLCCFDDEWEEMEEDTSEEPCDDALDCEENADPPPEEEIVESLCLPSEIHSAFIKHNLTAKVLKKAHPVEQTQSGLFESSDSGKTILQRLQDLQARALLCLSNMVSALYKADDSEGSHPATIVSVWAELYGHAKSYKGDNEDFIWSLTSAMRSVLQKMSETDGQQIKNVTEEDLEFLVQIGTASKNPETQINVIRMVSIIGCVMAVDPDKFHLVKTIAEILLKVCSSNEDLVVISETLDSLFDIFKEDETDPVAKQIGLVHHLKTFLPIFRTKVSSESKKLGQHYGIVMMAKSNLTAFVKYKMKRHL